MSSPNQPVSIIQKSQSNIDVLLTQIAISVTEFNLRFPLSSKFSQMDAIEARLKVIREETEELSDDVRNGRNDEIAMALMDVLYSTLRMVAVLNATDIENAARVVIQKNDAKTTESHYISSSGKVVKIE